MNLTPDQTDTLARTLLGEAANQGLRGMEAVAWVIKNRADSGLFGTGDPSAIALQHNQFSAWNSLSNGGNNVGRNASPDSASYQRAVEAINNVFGGTVADPTGGATYYYAPAGMPGGRSPSWASGMQQTAQIGGHLFYSDPSHPIPPADIPSNADPINGGALQNPALMLPLPAPPPLISAPPPLKPPGSSTFNGLLPPQAQYGVDRLNPNGTPTPPPTDFTTAPTGNYDPSLYGMIAPQAPRMDALSSGPGSFADLQSAFGLNKPAAPPAPFPTPSFARPVVGQPPAVSPSTAQPGAHTPVRLPSGKIAMTGEYPIPSNPGSTSVITDDGHGNAVVNVVNRGLINPMKMSKDDGTIFGSMFGNAKEGAAQAINNAVTGTLDSAGNALTGAKDAALSGVTGAATGAFNALGNLFGGAPKPPSVPAPPASYTSSMPTTSNGWASPIQGFTPPAPPPAPTSVTNPAYTAWAAQYGNQGGLSTGTSQNTVSSKFNDGGDLLTPLPVVPPAPPKYIAAPVPLARPPIPPSIGAPMPLPNPSWLAPTIQPPNPLQTLFNMTPAGHLYQLVTGQPVTGGVLSLFNKQPGSGGGNGGGNGGGSGSHVPAGMVKLSDGSLVQGGKPGQTYALSTPTGNAWRDSMNPNIYGT